MNADINGDISQLSLCSVLAQAEYLLYISKLRLYRFGGEISYEYQRWS